jgi:hypothetical protein
VKSKRGTELGGEPAQRRNKWADRRFHLHREIQRRVGARESAEFRVELNRMRRPMLAAVLIVVAFNMGDWGEFRVLQSGE